MANVRNANHMRLFGSVNSKLDRLNKADETHNYVIHVEDGPWALNVFACTNCKLTVWESQIPAIELDGSSTSDHKCEEPFAMKEERTRNKAREMGMSLPGYFKYVRKKEYRERLGTCKCSPVHVC